MARRKGVLGLRGPPPKFDVDEVVDWLLYHRATNCPNPRRDATHHACAARLFGVTREAIRLRLLAFEQHALARLREVPALRELAGVED